MKRHLVLLLFLGIGCLGASARAQDHAGYLFLDKLDAELEAGELSLDDALLYKFYYVFDSQRLPESHRPEAFPPLKCATPLIREFEKAAPQLLPATITIIEDLLAPPSESRSVLISPSARFRLSYAVAGANAVPPEDVDPADGVPDFVNRAAARLDEVWERVVGEMAYRPPPASPWYEVDFRDMAAIGYTGVVSGTTTRITLENDFVGAPPNADPAGDAIGALKAACAHQFKHASQRATSGWSEGGWIELDATWLEDVVYDEVDDYVAFLGAGNGIVAPGVPLDAEGFGDHEDCLWQHLLVRLHGPDLMHGFWERRRTQPGESVLATYATVAAAAGGGLADDHGLYGAWNLATGNDALPGVGYPGAAAYPNAKSEAVVDYPHASHGRLAHLSHHFVRAGGFAPGETGVLRVGFDGEDDAVLRLHAVIARRDGTGYRVEIPLDAANDADLALGLPLSDIETVGLALSNAALEGSAVAWSLDLSIDGADTAAPDAPTPLAPPRVVPNPFNPVVTVAFDLPAPGPVVVDLLDLRGRTVRILLAADRLAGPGAVRWDGADAAGRSVASGPYLVRVRHGGRTAVRAVTLAR